MKRDYITHLYRPRHDPARTIQQFKCGPAAISAIAAISCEDAADIINDIRNHPRDRKIAGVWPAELLNALRRLGYYPDRVFEGYSMITRPTLTRYLKHERGDLYDQTLLVVTTSHFQVARGIMVADNNRKMTTYGNAFGRRARVSLVFRFYQR